MSQRLVAVFTPFEKLTDPRVKRSRRHELFDVVVVALCGTLAGSDTWADIERFGKARIEWLRMFLRLENGIPSHDTFGRVFSRLDPARLLACVQQWLDDIGLEIGKHIAIDGKTLRRSFDTAAGKNPLHLVSAWACEARLTLGQVATDAKSNEITAIPLLLELLDLKGATVTIDAMGCQKEIAEMIVERQGDYLLALKDNHPKLCEAVAAEFTAALEADVPPRELRRHGKNHADHRVCFIYFGGLPWGCHRCRKKLSRQWRRVPALGPGDDSFFGVVFAGIGRAGGFDVSVGHPMRTLSAEAEVRDRIRSFVDGHQFWSRHHGSSHGIARKGKASRRVPAGVSVKTPGIRASYSGLAESPAAGN